MKLLIKGARVIDPANNIDDSLDILIEGSKVSRLAKGIKNGADEVIEASGRIVIPGIVDMHAHLREPGREDKETVESATKAALRGGVTTLLAMPNTSPVIDSAGQARLLKEIVKQSAKANVFICAAITKERNGLELTDFSALKKEGVIALSDDGGAVDSEGLMLEALKMAHREGLILTSHSEDKKLSNGGVVNLGFTSTRMGLRGVSRESEYKRIERDIGLAQKALAPIHIMHVSCAESVEIIAKAKKEGLRVTCETAPHYFALSEENVLGYDTNMKMNPPLRRKEDVSAIRNGLRDGTIDVIASDHAPHTENEKEIEFERAEFGVIGLETELAVSITELIKSGLLDWQELTRKLCLNPAKILGIDKGTLGIGKDADLVILSPDAEWLVKKEDFLSKSKNSPFIGRKLSGIVEFTFIAGKPAFKNIADTTRF